MREEVENFYRDEMDSSENNWIYLNEEEVFDENKPGYSKVVGYDPDEDYRFEQLVSAGVEGEWILMERPLDGLLEQERDPVNAAMIGLEQDSQYFTSDSLYRG